MTQGKTLSVLKAEVGLDILAVTDWKDRVGGATYPWYRVAVQDGSDRTGWVYGKYVTFEPGYPLSAWQASHVSHRQMNRPLLVVELFRRLLGTDTRDVSNSWLEGLPSTSRSQIPQVFPTQDSLRTYKTPFGRVSVLYNLRKRHQLVLSLSVDQPVGGLLLSVGDPVSRVDALLGSDYYIQGGSRYYRGVPNVENYGINLRIANGMVAAIGLVALVE